MTRPILDKNLDSKTFRNYYFLKEKIQELTLQLLEVSNKTISSGTVEVTYGASESYTVTIPADITLTANQESDIEISASDVVIPYGNELTVSISSTNYTDSKWQHHPDRCRRHDRETGSHFENMCALSLCFFAFDFNIGLLHVRSLLQSDTLQCLNLSNISYIP